MKKKRTMLRAMKMTRALLCLGVPVSIQSKLMTRLSQRHFNKLLADLINLIGVEYSCGPGVDANWRCFELPNYQADNVLSARSECSRSSEKPMDPFGSTMRDWWPRVSRKRVVSTRPTHSHPSSSTSRCALLLCWRSISDGPWINLTLLLHFSMA